MRPPELKTKNDSSGATSGSTSSFAPSLNGSCFADWYSPFLNSDMYIDFAASGPITVMYKLPLAAMLGFQIEPLMFTASGKRTGTDHPLAVRSTRHKFETTPTGADPFVAEPLAASFGRVDWNTTYFPSGDHAGDESGHAPENAATFGALHVP